MGRRHRPIPARLTLAAFALLAAVPIVHPAAAEPRVALVVGNSHYGGDLGLLPNPVNDAKLMAQTLRKVGFDVVEVEDADQQAMKKAILEFGNKLSTAGIGATGLFFYAGHGLQVGGENYLVPIHADVHKVNDVDVEAVPIDMVLKQMDFAQSAVNIVILDACRNNPLADSGRGISRGLAEIKTKPIGSFISYSTAPGEVAEDGNGANSPYTAALAEEILRPGLDLAEVFRGVRKDVLKATNQKQVPWDSWSLTDPFYFIPPRPNPQPGAAAADGSAPSASDVMQNERMFWDSIKNSSNAADFQAYLDQYPTGSFAKLAQIRVQALAPKQTAEAERTVNPAPTGSTEIFVAEDRDIFTTEKAPIYAAPDADSDVITHAAGGLAVRASGKSSDGQWWQLHLPNGSIAYAKIGDMKEQGPAPAQTAEADADQTAATDTPSPDEAVAKQYLDLGQTLLGQGDFKGARDAFDHAAQRNPKDAQAVLRRGQASLGLGDVDHAQADFERAIALDPNAIEAYGFLVLAQLESGDATAAAKTADKAQEIEPTFWSVNAEAAYYLAGRLPEAQAMAERVLQDNPEDAHSWIWQALVLRAQGRDGEAADLLASSIDSIGNRDWPVAVIEWMQGKRTPERLLVAAKAGDPATALRQISETDFFLGEAAYANGDRVSAQKYLGQADDAKAPDLLAYAATKALLAKIARE